MTHRLVAGVAAGAMAVAGVLAATPVPTPTPTINPEDVTPGPVGFAVMFIVTVAAILVIVDMARRVRRVEHRSRVKRDVEQRERNASRQEPEIDTTGSAGSVGGPAAGGAHASQSPGGPFDADLGGANTDEPNPHEPNPHDPTEDPR